METASLDRLETSGPVQACTGIASPIYVASILGYFCFVLLIHVKCGCGDVKNISVEDWRLFHGEDKEN
jgi:hypothetical protein